MAQFVSSVLYDMVESEMRHAPPSVPRVTAGRSGLVTLTVVIKEVVVSGNYVICVH